MLNPKKIFDELPLPAKMKSIETVTFLFTFVKYTCLRKKNSKTMKSIAGSRSPFRAHGEHSAECLPHGQPRRRDLGQVPRMDGPR